MTETQLVELARDGDQAAMSALYQAHARRVYTVVRRLVGDDHLAEDASQDAWIRAFQKLHLFRGEAAFGTWLHRLAVNTALNRLRKRGRRGEVERETEAEPALPDGPGLDETVLTQRVLAQALDRLPPGYRQVLVMHDVEGLKHEEIAGLLGVSVGTSKSQLHKARARMRQMLAPQRARTEAGNDG